jgi:hypothetical protein
MFSVWSFILLSNMFANNTITSSTDITLFKRFIKEDFTDFIFKINEANRRINDYCDIVQVREGILSNEKKPFCIRNLSYIDSNYTIHVFKNKENVRTFFEQKRGEYCKQKNILCGELTILIKMFDLINGVTDIMMKTSHTYEIIMFNLDVVDFKKLYQLYLNSLDNTELLINITMNREYVNVLLEREKTRLNKMMNQAYFEKFADNVNLYVGSPILSSVKYVGSTIGTLFGEAIESVMPETTFESKIIILILLLIILKKY